MDGTTTMPSQRMTLTLDREKECKHSVRFAAQDEKSPIQTVYVDRQWVGVNAATGLVLDVTLKV